MIEVTNKNIEDLRKKANRLPLSPGVYLMKDKNEKIIYVGKSKALKNRVLSYFTDIDNHTVKTKRLVQNIYDFDTMLTTTEIEALALENTEEKMARLEEYRVNLCMECGCCSTYFFKTFIALSLFLNWLRSS